MLTLDFKDISFMFILSPPVYKSFDVFRNGMNSLKRNFFLNSISKLRLAFLQILSFPDESGVEQYFMLERKKGRRMMRRVVVVGEEHFRPEQSNAFHSILPQTLFSSKRQHSSMHVFLCIRVHEGKWISLVEGQVWQ